MARQTSQMVSLLPAGPVALPELVLVESQAASIGLRLCAPTADDFSLDALPTILLPHMPLVITFCSLDDSATGTEAIARFIEQHLKVVVSVAASLTTTPGDTTEPDVASLAVSARPVNDGRRIAARVSPSSWDLASAVTLRELLLAGSPFPVASLPARLRVGFNHDPAPCGEVYAAAQMGDALALQVALAAGGSTEETNNVSSRIRGVPQRIQHAALMVFSLSAG